MSQLARRRFLAITAAAINTSVAWAKNHSTPSRCVVAENRELFPQGVASGDPDPRSVILWTRRPFSNIVRSQLRVEVSEDEDFKRVVATAKTPVAEASDWTCRVLVGNLRPSRVYWYRFIDGQLNASRIGRTITAPTNEDTRPRRFAFVSCQNITIGSLHAYHRMVYEDQRAAETDRLGFVLHLGDFIYEIVWYPEDNPFGYGGRRLRNNLRYPHGERIDAEGLGVVHIPTTLEDYRTAYRAYLQDTDLQDARARWPFVCIWDNCEFSAAGWQSVQAFNGLNKPAQTRKVAANQAWFEYQPARVLKSSGSSLERFDPPRAENVSIERFDDDGFGDERNNHTAVDSLTGYRAFRWGRNLELIITDQRSYRCEYIYSRPELAAFRNEKFFYCFPQEVMEILDAGRTYDRGKPPQTIHFGRHQITNFRKDSAPQTVLGREQKKWFLGRLKGSQATWKIWANTMGTLEMRIDPQNVPSGITESWPGGYSTTPTNDHSTAYSERAEIYNFVRDHGITGFTTICGDRHAFHAGLAAAFLPPRAFEPVGVVFITAAITSAAAVQVADWGLPADYPLRALFVGRRTPGGAPEPMFNMLLRHGVRSCFEYHNTGDIERARRVSNPDLSPHLTFADLESNGYAKVCASSDALECEFVAMPPPLESTGEPDGGPLRYRVSHRVRLWRAGERPKIELRVIEGNPQLSL